MRDDLISISNPLNDIVLVANKDMATRLFLLNAATEQVHAQTTAEPTVPTTLLAKSYNNKNTDLLYRLHGGDCFFQLEKGTKLTM